jgi:hypothetical protein
MNASAASIERPDHTAKDGIETTSKIYMFLSYKKYEPLVKKSRVFSAPEKP